jgi:hypothetical protein
MYEEDIYKNFTVAQLCQVIPFRFWQVNIPVSYSKQKITDRQAKPQEHSSHRYKKSDVLEINVTEGETS